LRPQGACERDSGADQQAAQLRLAAGHGGGHREGQVQHPGGRVGADCGQGQPAREHQDTDEGGGVYCVLQKSDQDQGAAQRTGGREAVSMMVSQCGYCSIMAID